MKLYLFDLTRFARTLKDYIVVLLDHKSDRVIFSRR